MALGPRLRGDEPPVDVFLSNHPVHAAAATRCRQVPFGAVEDFPVLACEDLAVFKAFFARPKDAVDLASMVEAEAIDAASLLAMVADLLGADHPAVAFVARATGLRPE